MGSGLFLLSKSTGSRILQVGSSGQYLLGEGCIFDGPLNIFFRGQGRVFFYALITCLTTGMCALVSSMRVIIIGE